jgi:FkbM family methyltransferase
MSVSIQHLNKDFNLFKFHTKTWLAGMYFTLLRKEKIKLNGVELLVPYDVTDIRLRGQFQIGSYEKRERLYLKEYLHPESSVLELGGCLGVVACVANRLLKHPERHVVVEANPRMIPYMERNRAHTGSSFFIENCVISNSPSNEFYIGPTIGESSMRRKWSEKISVRGKTVADLEQTHNLKFDTLIMDIEGAELGFLRENRQWLKQLHTVMLEIHPHPELLSDDEVAECRTILESAGLSNRVVDGLIWVFKRP